MSKAGNKSLIIIIIILLITNVVMLAVWWKSNSHEEKKPGKSKMAEYLKTDLGFSQQQMTLFDSIKTEHRSEAKKLFDGFRAEKSSIYKEIGKQEFADSSLNAAAGFAAQKQLVLEKMMLDHLKEIRALCTPAQLPKFDTGFYKIMMRGGKSSEK